MLFARSMQPICKLKSVRSHFRAGFPMEIYAIANGQVLAYILDPNFERYLPVIPSEVLSSFVITSGISFILKIGLASRTSFSFRS